MMDKKLVWRLTAKSRVTQMLVFPGKVAGRNNGRHQGLQTKAWAVRDS